MAFDPNLAPNLGDLSLFVDQERGAFDAHIGAAVILLFGPDPQGIGQATFFCICRQWSGQLMLGDKILVLLGLILADPQHGCASCIEITL